MTMPCTPPYTPLTDSSSPVLAKEKLPAHPKYQQAISLLTPPQTPEIETVRNHLSERLQIQCQGRKLSDNEISYYLPSRGDGVNDMYVHHKLLASSSQMSPSRILHIWAYQLLLHPLLAATTRFNSYEDIDFVPTRPTSLIDALTVAANRFSFLTDDRDIIDTYLNGPRTLSDERLGYLVVKAPAAVNEAPLEKEEYEIMLCATHYLGDGMALHSFMNEFYTILGSDQSTELIASLIEEKLSGKPVGIPQSLEERLPLVGGGSKLASAVGKDELARSEKKLIGGQSFGTNKDKLPRQTAVPTISYDKDTTKVILGNCKQNGVTIAHAVFALCNIAWARRTSDKFDPCLIYSALNLRPNMLPATPESSESFFHLAVGYFNIVLPTLLPSIPVSDLFWHRARMTKNQTMKAVKSPFVVARSRNTSIVRKDRAVKWAAIDDKEAEEAKAKQLNGNGNGNAERKVSQKALMGLSMLGNLDGMYKHASFPSLELTSLTTGSRQRNGALLLFAYTFAGKLWFSLGYDKNGFPAGVIEGFWQECQNLIDEVLV
uniref:Condensation domain-containing protein n=1 Tax=Kwoniella dejecticola CBS 10117 TaxID=1296121 RepID=A0A1A5ZVT2_9TREE|nr:uncharacterized protein I303_07825 [Kwoniella dejecticola CBS 10117]OBR81915.1 hypothetical protein I303_07825 [Kwoniella dejecticola CBS 10117]